MSDARPKFGSYVLGPRLGVGGMAAAYEALKRGPGGFEQKVCLKRVLPVYREDPEFRRLFMREAKIAASLRHSNIVGVIDFGEVHGEPYLALELIDGVDLRTLLRRQELRRLPVDEVLLVGIELARALEYAHHVEHEGGTGVLHRDISPSNVLVSTSGEIKLGDFGIAKLMGSAGATASAALRGKLSYLAPETADGTTVDVRADIFALGVMLYEACHGYRPFDGSNDSQTFAAIQSGEAKPWKLETGPEGLERLVSTMIARSPDDRPTSAEALLEALCTVRKSLSDYGDLGPRRSLGWKVKETKGALSQELVATQAVELSGANERKAGPPAARIRRAEPEDPTRTQLPKTQPGSTSAETRKRNVSNPDLHERATHLLDAKETTKGAKWLWTAAVGAGLLALALLVAFAEGEGPATSAAVAPQRSTGNTGRNTEIAAKVDAEAKAPMIGETATTSALLSDASSITDVVTDAGRSAPPEGRVHVTVMPWGNIWIDGARRGRAPRWITLRPGTHRIAGGRSTIEKTRRIRVTPGKSRRVLIDLGSP